VAAGSLPVLGHSSRLVRDPLGFLCGLRDQGELVRIRLGPRTAYVVTAPDLVGELLKSPGYRVDGPLWQTLKSLLGEGVATANGARHRRLRRMIQPAFRPELIPQYATVMQEEAELLAGRWQPHGTVDVTAETFRVAVRVTARCLLRCESMDERAERLSIALGTVFRGMYRRMVLSAGPLYRLPLPANRRFDRALADLHRLVDEVIADRRAATQRPDDLLTALLEERNEDGTAITEQEIHDQVVAIVTPGAETVASTLMSMLQLLADLPEQSDRLDAEIQATVGDRPVTFADLPNLPGLNNFLTESLRLRPAVWIMTRRAEVETELGGYRIPAGADIVFSPYAIQRDPRSYAGHLDFDPDRWQPDRTADVPRYAMIPFSTGNRKCPADNFSMAQLALIIATVVHRWRFERAPNSDDAIRIGITLRPRRLMLRTVPRHE
jgi:epi-isozizaene 5-monooxygenase